MSASDHINETLFHGTSRRFKVGDVVLPAQQTGATQNWGSKSKNNPKVAYATDSMDSAQYYASVSKLMNDHSTARSRVYQVEPVNPETAQWEEKKYRDGTLRQHTSPEGYKVVRRAWIQRK